MPLCDVRFDPKWIPIVRLGRLVQCPRNGLDTRSVCLGVERFLFGVSGLLNVRVVSGGEGGVGISRLVVGHRIILCRPYPERGYDREGSRLGV